MNLAALCSQAAELQQKGRLGEAEKIYLQVLAIEPANFVASHFLGALRSQQGRHHEALALIRTALSSKPSDARVLWSFANELIATGRSAEALGYYEKAIAIQPVFPEALFNRGVLLAAMKRTEEALENYDRALAIKPAFTQALLKRGQLLARINRLQEALISFERVLVIAPNLWEAHYCRGNVLRALGRLDEAIVCYDRLLAADKKHFGVLYNRGLALHRLRRLDEALLSFEAACDAEKNDADALNGRGVVLQELGQLSEALASYDDALARDPSHVGAWNNRGAALLAFRRNIESLESFDRALGLDPEHFEAWNNRGSCLEALRRFEEASESYEKALVVHPNYVAALYNRGNALWDQKRDLGSALRDLEKVVALDPEYPYARGDLLHLRMYNGDWRDFEREIALLDGAVRLEKRAAKPFVYQSIAQSPADLQICSKIYADHHYPPREPLLSQKRAGRAKIRVGYVSGEFRDQATAYLTAGLYELHDKTKFEIIAFDNGWNDHSIIRGRLEAAFDKFIDISNLSDKEAAEAVLAEGIDILVNLNGYFGLPRMGVFAYRPAPIQVNYLGFPGTLGAPYMDYILADEFVIPKSASQFYAEKIVYLPHSYQVNDCHRPVAGKSSRSDLGLPEDAIVFCNFNLSYKLTPMMFETWMRILQQVDGSVLWLLDGAANFSANLRRVATARGIDGKRLIFAPFTSVNDHLARLTSADLFLDSLPYNAHTTGSDALWAGVPLLTCLGETFPGRVGASLLHAIGLPELVTRNLQEYISLAVTLAATPDLLRSIRERLARNRTRSPLFDTDQFRRNIEAAYTAMWEIQDAGDSPRSFTVPPT